MQDSDNLTLHLKRWRSGNKQSLDLVMSCVISKLRAIAGNYLKQEHANHTLQATALVNEAYIKLVGNQADWQDRAHFFAIAAKQMRHILIDHARSKHRQKRAGNAPHLPYSETISTSTGTLEDFVIVEELLTQMEQFDQRAARVFELKFFGGLTADEIAEVEQLSRATVNRELKVSKAWILKELKKLSPN